VFRGERTARVMHDAGCGYANVCFVEPTPFAMSHSAVPAAEWLDFARRRLSGGVLCGR
jgi:hypothetical protein